MPHIPASGLWLACFCHLRIEGERTATGRRFVLGRFPSSIGRCVKARTTNRASAGHIGCAYVTKRGCPTPCQGNHVQVLPINIFPHPCFPRIPSEVRGSSGGVPESGQPRDAGDQHPATRAACRKKPAATGSDVCRKLSQSKVRLLRRMRRQVCQRLRFSVLAAPRWMCHGGFA